MFCRKCGKYISYEADTCNECKAMENGMPPAYTAVMDSTAAPVGNRKYGLGLAIAGAVIGVFSFIYLMMAYLFALILSVAKDVGYSSMDMTAAEAEALSIAVVVLAILGVLIAVPALIFGIVSMKRFFTKKRLGEVTPIPAFIIGIVTVGETALGFLFALISLALISI